ncbi:hypothetical protein [Flavobacterium orientale]|uniref:Lipoprotein n=1 Tax=Flavobacterium orientale TaxID=1756020 RepID=A0A917DCI4_9FLAO|nr:hypothetical protein [Flavobacterium orientale]GGD26688.1 hypothetical protein GCM10011343_16160 [Flavobacterium orientale]
MKKIILLCLVVLISSCKSTKGVVTTKPTDKPNYEVLALSEVSTLQKNRTYELGKRVLMTCNTSAFKPFTSQEATNEVITNINKEKISLTCHNVLRGFGKFNDMKLIEVIRDNTNSISIFRYQCDYEKKYRIKELRVSINDDNKVTAINSKDWKDAFN